jgi:uncharacterized membrane protein YbjE (DUF340 family)
MGATFVWYSLAALILCLAVYGALALFNTPTCNLGIGALL